MYYALQLRYITNSLLVPLQECPCYLNIVDFYSRWKQQKYFKILHIRGIQYPSFSKGIVIFLKMKKERSGMSYLRLLVYPKAGEHLKVNFLTTCGILPSLKGEVNFSPVQLQPYLAVGRFNLCFWTLWVSSIWSNQLCSGSSLWFFYLFPHPVNTHLNF